MQAAIEIMRPHFQRHGYSVPECSVTCGWPSKLGLSQKKRRIGECWTGKVSADKKAAIFISPILGEKVESEGDVLATLVHEVVHAVVGLKCGHRGDFPKCAKAVGLVGKMTCTTAGPELVEVMRGWSKDLGTYPHGVMRPGDADTNAPKKQSTRMIKCECEHCGYSVRTTRKWLEEAGAPICPLKGHGPMSFEIPDELQDKDED